MREILFRGKRLDNGEWIEGDLKRDDLDFDTDIVYIYFHNKIEGRYETAEVDPATIGQFTGIYDKNGKRIFEGDIVKVHDAYKQYGEPNHEFTGVVEFDNASFLINQGDFCHHYRWMDYECEVVSNIHLPKFNNNGRMIFNCMDYQRDTITPKIHPTQKSIHVLKNLISIFTDPGDVAIDPCAGSGVTLLAAEQLGRKSYGFEIKKEYVEGFKRELASNVQVTFYQQETRKEYKQLTI